MTQDWKEKLYKVIYEDCGNIEITWGEVIDGNTQPIFDCVESLLKEERTAVLEEVEREVEKLPVGYLVMGGEVDDVDAPGYSQCREDISTIINNIRVK